MRNDVKLALGAFAAAAAATACHVEEDIEALEQEVAQDETEDVELAACPAFSVSLSRFFSPNGDGINDVWSVMDGSGGEGSIFALSYDLLIWNEQGTIVYDVHGLEKSRIPGLISYYRGGEIFWTGRNLLPTPGPVQPPGVYYYRLTLRNCERVATSRSASITLLL